MKKLPYALFFILGRGRSGTTLLRFLLNAHPKLSVAPEAMFIISLYKKYARVKAWDKARRLAFYDDLWLEKRLDNWHLDPDKLKQDLLALGDQACFADLCRLVYANYASAQGKENVVIFGDKNPHYCLFTKELLDLFPASRFIHMVRDYRDNILSYQRVKFDVNNTSALAYRWKRYNQEILKYRQRYPERFIFFRYEDLLAEPEHHLEKICRFIGVDFDPVMLDFYTNARQTPGWEWHANLSRPLDKARAYLWKTEMKKTDVLKADYICRDIASVFGYENSHTSRSAKLYLLTRPGVFIGWAATCLEKLIFSLPVRLKARVINFYRTITGSLKQTR